MTEPELDRRLLGYVVQSPRLALVMAIATGLAVALELVGRGEMGVLQTLSRDAGLCKATAERVLRCWAAADRAGAMQLDVFERLCDEVIASVRAS